VKAFTAGVKIGFRGDTLTVFPSADPFSQFDNLARYFMTQRHGRVRLKLVKVDVQVSPANARRIDLDEHLAWAWKRLGHILHFDVSHSSCRFAYR
jgi:hypothetical protein